MQWLTDSKDGSFLDKDEFKSQTKQFNGIGPYTSADYMRMLTEHKSKLDAKEPSDENMSKTGAVKSKKTSKTKNKDS